jgi:hypothetical protein
MMAAMWRGILLTVGVLAAAAGDALAQPDAAPAPDAPPADPPPPDAPPSEPEPKQPPATVPTAPATEEDDGEDWNDEPTFQTNAYGFIDAQFLELAFSAGLAGQEALIEREVREEKERYTLNLNLMLQGLIGQRFHWFLNFGGIDADDVDKDDLPLAIRNAWVEYPLYRDYLVLRLGKTYRRFGLYNEILDAAPTFPGVEAPEFLVEGQQLLTRTTNVMLHGTWVRGDDRLQYTLHTGNDEIATTEVPIGGDVRYALGDMLLFGSSFYWSGGAARPTRNVGNGPPLGGVINWMADDKFYVVGGYAQLTRNNLLVQVEYWRAHHDAERNPAAMLLVGAGAERLSPRLRQRFFNGVDDPMLTDVNINTAYEVQTAWSRIAYELDLGGAGAITPYVHLDWYSHPEAVDGSALGGNEAGLSDDGVLYKTVVGGVYRAIPQLAVKAELNPHIVLIDGSRGVFSPFQISISYYWRLGDD